MNEKISAIIQEINFYQREGVMKLRIYTILSVFILSITFLMSCSTTTGQGPEETKCESRQTVEEIMSKITLGTTVERHVTIKGIKIDKVRKAAEKIHEDYLNLCKSFENGDYNEMKKYLKKASLKTKDDQIIRGKKNIK